MQVIRVLLAFTISLQIHPRGGLAIVVLYCLLEYIDIPRLLASWRVSWTPSDSLNSVTNGPSYSFASLPSFRLGKNYLIWVHVPLSWSSTARLYTGARAHRIVAAHLHISYSYSYFIFIFIFHIHIHLRLYLSLCLEF